MPFLNRIFGGNKSGVQLRENDLLVALVGVTGSGRSSFLSKATGRPEHADRVSPPGSIKPKTTEIFSMHFPHPDHPTRRIYLIDTPGFDTATDRNEVAILKDVLKYITKNYPGRKSANALLYFHSVANPPEGERLGEFTAINNLFRKSSKLQNVILVTTMWGEEVVDQEERENEKASLRCWNFMTRFGARSHRFHNNHQSALDVLRMIHAHHQHDNYDRESS